MLGENITEKKCLFTLRRKKEESQSATRARKKKKRDLPSIHK